MQKKVAFYSLEMPILGKSGWSLENLLFLFIYFYYLGFSLYGNLDYMESRYGDGKVLGTQLHSTSRSASTRCVPNLNSIKGSSNRLF